MLKKTPIKWKWFQHYGNNSLLICPLIGISSKSIGIDSLNFCTSHGISSSLREIAFLFFIFNHKLYTLSILHHHQLREIKKIYEFRFSCTQIRQPKRHTHQQILRRHLLTTGTHPQANTALD